jgi:hypothetical protein
MWYEAEDQFVRARTPAVFDKLVQQLENADSVLFESLSLPRSSLAQNPRRRSAQPPQSPPTPTGAPKLHIGDLDFTDPLPDDDDPESDLAALRDRLRDIEIMGLRKMEIIRAKDQQIMLMEQQLTDLRKAMQKPGKEVQTSDSQTAEFYKKKFADVKQEFEDLKRSLVEDGRLRKVSARSARAVRPNLL